MKFSIILALIVLIITLALASIISLAKENESTDFFSLHSKNAETFGIARTFSESTEISVPEIEREIYGLSVDAEISLKSDSALARIILVDSQDNEHLAYETYPLIADKFDIREFSFINSCDETCLLDSVIPKSLRIELYDAEINVNSINFVIRKNDLDGKIKNIAAEKSRLKRLQDDFKINMINRHTGKDMLWIAGETDVSKKTFDEKKMLFGNNKAPNLQGFEYYKGGIFELKSLINASSQYQESPSKSSFDWRSVHGADNPASLYYDGDPSGSGWMTPVKDQEQCGSCWDFAATGAVEAVANLYFNQHIDFDLSEQDVLSCGSAGSCQGGWPDDAIDYIHEFGIVDEPCFEYAACDKYGQGYGCIDGQPVLCNEKCLRPQSTLKVAGKIQFGNVVYLRSEETLKRMLLDYGPITAGVSMWWHVMTLVGFDVIEEGDIIYANGGEIVVPQGYPLIGQTYFIYKNSWGDSWGDDGYANFHSDIYDVGFTDAVLTPVTITPENYDIQCNDFDGDSFCNWGIFPVKPDSCPQSCGPLKDWDDSDPGINDCFIDEHCPGICSGNIHIIQSCRDGACEPSGSEECSLGCTSGNCNSNIEEINQCTDGIDNDNDGGCDYNGCVISGIEYEKDFSCTHEYDDNEVSPLAECQDWIDNDYDNAVDYPEDAQCYSLQDNDEEHSSSPQWNTYPLDIATDEDTAFTQIIDFWDYTYDYDTPLEQLVFFPFGPDPDYLSCSFFGDNNRYFTCDPPPQNWHGTRFRGVGVADPEGNVNHNTVRMTVNSINDAPAAYILSPANGTSTVRRTISFSGMGNDIDGTISYYRWDFNGDGVFDFQGTTGEATYTYPAPGTYAVSLVVADNDSMESDPDMISITIIGAINIG